MTPLTLSIRKITLAASKMLPKMNYSRTELVQNECANWKELDSWLLWAGISPHAQEPMSHIGIYTDFT